MKDLTSTSFGYLIGFLLPGIFGLYALSFWFPPVGVLLQPILKADTTLGPSAVFLVIAIGMGLCVSAARFFLFEKLLCKKHHLPPDLFALLNSEGKLRSFRAVVDEHYRYHQFYGGSAVAALISFFGWWHVHSWSLNRQTAYMSIGVFLLEILLIASARDSLIQYVKRGCVIIQGVKIERGAFE